MSTGELWMPVRGYEGLYMVSNLGRIMGLKRNKVLRTRKNHRGYEQANLSKHSVMTTHRVHRLVATHFVPNPMDLPEVNHINENKLDNRAENLEWCDRAYNVNFGGRTEQQKAKVSKSVVQLSTNDEVIAVFPSGIQAAREFQISSSAITACCRGNRKTAGGFKWKYEKEVDK